MNASGDGHQPILEPLDDAEDHVRGPADGRLILEYGDYGCPYSRGRFTRSNLSSRSGRGYSLRVPPFPTDRHSPHAFAAAAAAEAASLQSRFWDLHELLFHRQKALEEDDLQRYAAELGLDLARFVRERTCDRVGADRRDVDSGMAWTRCAAHRPCSSTVSFTPAATTLLPSPRHWPAELPPPRQLQ